MITNDRKHNAGAPACGSRPFRCSFRVVPCFPVPALRERPLFLCHCALRRIRLPQRAKARAAVCPIPITILDSGCLGAMPDPPAPAVSRRVLRTAGTTSGHPHGRVPTGWMWQRGVGSAWSRQHDQTRRRTTRQQHTRRDRKREDNAKQRGRTSAATTQRGRLLH